MPFSLEVYWHDIDTEEGDRLYGLADVYADPAYATNIGTMEMDVIRLADDVTKTADVTSAELGDTITYTIEIAPNMSPDDLTYTINDVLPEGVTYVPGSVTGGATYDAGTNSILWTGVMPGSSTYYYAPTTSAADPNCTLGYLWPMVIRPMITWTGRPPAMASVQPAQSLVMACGTAPSVPTPRSISTG